MVRGSGETLPVGSVPDLAVVRPAMDFAILVDTSRERLSRGGDALSDGRGVGVIVMLLEVGSGQVGRSRQGIYIFYGPLPFAPSAELGGFRSRRQRRERPPSGNPTWESRLWAMEDPTPSYLHGMFLLSLSR